MNRRLTFVVGLAALASIALPLRAADEKAKEKIVILDPVEGGIDYKLQGEYITSGDPKWGAQVIAMGDGKFHAVFEPGGLPGDGWDQKTRYETEGSTEGQTVTLHGVDQVAWGEKTQPAVPVEIKSGFEATIQGDTLTAKTPDGQTLTFKHTERKSPTEGLAAPAGATVLFDDTKINGLKGTKIIDQGPWKGMMKEGGETTQQVSDFTLHVEFELPFKPFARNQERCNSGIYIQQRYEMQILDSFGLRGYANECGGAYRQHPPLLNMAFPPLTWQTYDIEFKAARYENGKRVSMAMVTSKLNGVVVLDHYELTSQTGAGKKEKPTDNVQTGPIYLQSHNNPVAFRNVWMVTQK